MSTSSSPTAVSETARAARRTWVLVITSVASLMVVLDALVVATALTAIWLALVADPAVGYWAIVVPMVLSGTGIALCLPAVQSAVFTSVELRFIGKASSAFSAMRQLGGAFGVAVLVVGFSATGGYSSSESFTDGFTVALLAGAGLAFAGVPAGCVIPRKG